MSQPPPERIQFPQPTGKDSAEGLGCLIALFVIAAVPYGLYTVLNDNGWIPHTQTTDITFKGEWLIGENRICSGYQFNADYKPGIAIIHCPEDTSNQAHNIEIKFFGKIVRSDATFWDETAHTKYQWRCTRTSDGFTCYALN